MKKPKFKPSHNAREKPAPEPETAPGMGCALPAADQMIASGESDLSDFLQALPVSSQPVTFHRETDYDTLYPVDALASFLAFCRDVVERVDGNARVIDESNDETQDIMHYIELSEDLGVVAGYKAHVKLRSIRRARRDAKNENELLSPLYDFLTGTEFMQSLQRVLGATRARQEVIQKRVYGVRTDVLERDDE